MPKKDSQKKEPVEKKKRQVKKKQVKSKESLNVDKGHQSHTWRLEKDMASEVKDLCETVRDAGVHKQSLEIVGGGSKGTLGRPIQAAKRLQMTLLGIRLYEPRELVISAYAGTTMATLEAVLAENNQRFAFEPPDYRSLLCTEGTEPTIGGIIACNLSGPRRIQGGQARDYVLGVEFINGLAEYLRFGGRVMKNVSGYDLCKLVTGSYGTLGILTNVTLKVLPIPEQEATLFLQGLTLQVAQKAMAYALASPYDVSGVAHIPEGLTSRSRCMTIRDSGTSVTVLRLEGLERGLSLREKGLAEHLQSFGTLHRLDSLDSQVIWQDIRDVRLFAGTEPRTVWRISTTPSRVAECASEFLGALDADLFFDWGGGLIWLSPHQIQQEDTHASIIRKTLRHYGGHAHLLRADTSIRTAISVFEPLSPTIHTLTKELKNTFDPYHILNPGRMYPEL